MEARFLRQLAEIIDLGSMTLAAQSLNISQPTLSRNIKSLEALVKAPVLERGQYGVKATIIGELLAKEGRVIRESLRQVEIDLASWQGGLRGRLSIGVGAMLAHSIVPTFLADVSVSQWNVALTVEVQSADKLIERLRSGILDVAVLEFGPLLTREGLTEIAILDDPRGFYVGKTHKLASVSRISEEQILACEHITVGSFIEDRFRPATKSIRKTTQNPSIELSGDMGIALHLLSTGRFIAMLPQFVMENICSSGNYIRLPYAGRLPSKRLSIWHRAELSGNRLVGEFVNRFKQFTRQLSPPRTASVHDDDAGNKIAIADNAKHGNCSCRNGRKR